VTIAPAEKPRKPTLFKGLNPVSDTVLTRLVHVHLRNALLTLFHDAVLKHESRNASFLKPARHIVAFQIDGQRDEGSPEAIITPVPVPSFVAEGKPSDSGSPR
jgi:hypothetical protein